jgi:hypothetical protein
MVNPLGEIGDTGAIRRAGCREWERLEASVENVFLILVRW